MGINNSGEYILVVCPNPAVDIFAWVDSFGIGHSNRITKEKRFPGGKGVHVAMALAELEEKVILLGFWGAVTGDWIKQECKKYYPKMECHGPSLKEWTRTCYTFKSEGKFDDTEILGLGPEINEEHQAEFENLLNDFLPQSKAVAFCGSWPKGASAQAYQKLIRLANQHTIPSFLDCTGIQLKNALAEKPFGLHLNRSEVLAFTGLNSLQEAQKKISESCQVSAITDGAKGLYLHDGEKTFHSLAKIEKVYSTIGSGDCLLAGIIAGFVRQLVPQDIANLGAVCGAANCVNPNLGMIDKKDVLNLLEKI